MRTFVVLSIMIVLPLFALGQEFKMTSGIGYAIAGSSSLGEKKLMLCKELATALEVPIHGQLLYFDFSIGFRTILFETTNGASQFILNSWYYLIVPVSVIKYYTISRKSSLYWSFGLNGGYLFDIKRENISNVGTLPVDPEVGEYNVGLNGGVGLRTCINKQLSFSIGYSAARDIWRRARNNRAGYQIERRLLSVSFRKDL